MSEWEDEPAIDYGKREAETVILVAPAGESSMPERRVGAVWREKNPIMVEMGKSGGLARAVSLTPERRREIARRGGLARAAGKTRKP